MRTTVSFDHLTRDQHLDLIGKPFYMILVSKDPETPLVSFVTTGTWVSTSVSNGDNRAMITYEGPGESNVAAWDLDKYVSEITWDAT